MKLILLILLWANSFWMIAVIVEYSEIIEAWMMDHALLVGISCLVFWAVGCISFCIYWERTGKYRRVVG